MVALFVLAFGGVAAGQPAPLAQGLAPLDKVALAEMPAVNNGALEAKALAAAEVGAPLKFAEPHQVALSLWDSGSWDVEPSAGTTVWRQRVRSKGAESLNLGFSLFRLPEGAEMYLYSPDYESIRGPFNAAQNRPDGEFWSPIIESDEVVIELQVPLGLEGKVDLEVGSVNHGFRPFGAGAEKSGSCNVDVVCPEGDGWRDEIRSVGVYTVSGVFVCTGVLVNNTARDARQFFLTADHCSVGPNQAGSVVIYFNYENSTCRTPGSAESGGPGNGRLDQFVSGTTFRADYASSDFTLLEIDDPIPREYEVYFAGWDATGSTPSGAIAIHHPSTDEKRISFENDPLSVTGYLSDTPVANGTHWRVEDWDVGTTEPGSSGSPIFSPEGRIVGQLHGGFAACGNDDPDWYGRFSVSWDGGGSVDSRLSDWLDPMNTGELSIGGLDARGLSLGTPMIDDTGGIGDGDGVLEPGEGPVALTLPLLNDRESQVVIQSATLVSDSATATVTTAAASYPIIAPDAQAPNSTPFVIELARDHQCGAPVLLTLNIQTDEEEFFLPVSLPTGPVCDVVVAVRPTGQVNIDDSGGNGNGNGRLDAGETTVAITVPLWNDGAATGQSFEATLASETALATVREGTASQTYPALGTGEEDVAAAPFLLELHPDFPCGEPIQLRLDVPEQLGVGGTFSVATGSPRTRVYTQVPNRGIGPSPEVELFTFDISESGSIVDLDVGVTLTHTWVGDLSVDLDPPFQDIDGVRLFSRHGGGLDNLSGTLFDDQAATAIADGTPPYTGSFRPDTPLSVVNGRALPGLWRIVIEDHASLDGGTVDKLELVFDLLEPLCDPPRTVGSLLTYVETGIILQNGGTFDLGLAPPGAPPLTGTLRLSNTGQGQLLLLAQEFPVESLAPGSIQANRLFVDSLGPAESDTITFSLMESNIGVYTETLTISTNIPSSPPITLTLKGEIGELIPGDINNDKTVDGADEGLLRDHLEGLLDLSLQETDRADANLDDRVDAADLVTIMGMVPGH